MPNIPIEELVTLTKNAVEAASRMDGKRMAAAIHRLADDGGPTEALAFVTGCLRVVLAGVAPQNRRDVMPVVIAPAQDGGVEYMTPDDPRLDRGERTLIALSVAVLWDDPEVCWEIWYPFVMEASEAEIASIMEKVLTRAGAVLRHRRAGLS